MSESFDILIIGSGASGAQAAQVAVNAGLKVGLLDIGNKDDRFSSMIPPRPFSVIRRTDSNQRLYFLGDNPEKQIFPESDTGIHLTPPREFIAKDTETYLPLKSENFFPLQSLALGGLAAGWGGGCATLEDFELHRIGLNPDQIKLHYDAIARDIGISGETEDDTATHIASFKKLQSSLEVDTNAESLFRRYQKKRESFLKNGFKIGRHPLAILTESLGDRSANPYYDMDFWSDFGKSLYRPRYTIENLQKKDNFYYITPFLVHHFEETGDRVFVKAKNIRNGETTTFDCRKLFVAAGAINSARLVLRSLKQWGTRVPILSNPYTYSPCLNLAMLGRKAKERRYSLSQLTSIMIPPEDPQDFLVSHFFSYRSLLLFRLIRDMPLPPKAGLLLSRLILTSLTLVALNHSESPSALKYMELRKADDIDHLYISYERSTAEEELRRKRERRLVKFLLQLHCLPLKMVRLGHAASIHYAGTLPFSEEPKPLTCDASGKLFGTSHVHVVDGSTWKFLPAKAPTLTFMANARRIASEVVDQFPSPLGGRGVRGEGP